MRRAGHGTSVFPATLALLGHFVPAYRRQALISAISRATLDVYSASASLLSQGLKRVAYGGDPPTAGSVPVGHPYLCHRGSFLFLCSSLSFLHILSLSFSLSLLFPLSLSRLLQGLRFRRFSFRFPDIVIQARWQTDPWKRPPLIVLSDT